MIDWSVHVDNENEIGVYDTSAHATLEEIRNLLKHMLEIMANGPNVPQGLWTEARAKREAEAQQKRAELAKAINASGRMYQPL